ncbi:MAG: hypothetical protein JZD41_01065 [Thermoproteus sp.]|nr:hypothetical protein [Thermoproteus sp.]
MALTARGRIVAMGPPAEIKARLGFRPRVAAIVLCHSDFPYGVAEGDTE